MIISKSSSETSELCFELVLDMMKEVRMEKQAYAFARNHLAGKNG